MSSCLCLGIEDTFRTAATEVSLLAGSEEFNATKLFEVGKESFGFFFFLFHPNIDLAFWRFLLPLPCHPWIHLNVSFSSYGVQFSQHTSCSLNIHQARESSRPVPPAPDRAQQPCCICPASHAASIARGRGALPLAQDPSTLGPRASGHLFSQLSPSVPSKIKIW